jgi:hypothetical protein
MIYRLLADSVLIVHLLFIGFVIFGGLFALRFPWIALVHIPAACWGAYIELAGGLCPLTTIEVGLRRMAGDAGYPGSFIEHIFYPLSILPGSQETSKFGWRALSY